MPILPTYQGVSTSIATQRTQEAPLDPSGKQLEKLGQATENLGNTLTQVMQKRQALDDEASAMQRLVQANSDLSNMQDSFSKNEIGRDARNVYSKTVEEQRKAWFKDLTPGAAARLEQHLAPKLIEHRSAAYKVENRVHLNDYQAGGNAAATAFVESASRITDYKDGKDTKEYQALEQYYRVGEANGYYTKEEADKLLENALVAGSTSRVLKVSVSDDKTELENLLKVYDRQQIEGDTFLKNIPAEKRIHMQQVLKSRIEHLNNEEVRKKNQAYTDTQRQNAELSKATEIMAVQKLRDPAKYGPLTHDWLDLAAETNLIDAKDLNAWHDRVEAVSRGGAMTSGGYGNAALIHRLEVESLTIRNQEHARQVQAQTVDGIRRGEIPVGPGQPGDVILGRIDQMVRGPQDETLTPAKQLIQAKQEVDAKLAVSGPMASGPVKAIENAVKGEAYEVLHANARAGYPKTSAEVLEENMARWQIRVGLPAKISASEQRRNLGLPLVQGDPKGAAESTKAMGAKLKQEYAAAPPGPEGNATREAVMAKADRLKRLVDLEEEIAKYEAASGQSRATTQSSKPSNDKNKPMQGPRRPN